MVSSDGLFQLIRRMLCHRTRFGTSPLARETAGESEIRLSRRLREVPGSGLLQQELQRLARITLCRRELPERRFDGCTVPQHVRQILHTRPALLGDLLAHADREVRQIQSLSSIALELESLRAL